METDVLNHIYGGSCFNCKHHICVIGGNDKKIKDHICSFKDQFISCKDATSNEKFCGPKMIYFEHIEFYTELKFISEEEIENE